MLPEPGTAVILFVASGVSGVVGYTIFKNAGEYGPTLKPEDLLPMAPGEGPPLPRFFARFALKAPR